MFKMGLHDPFEYLKHKLWPKERPKVKLPIRLPTTKSQESPWCICLHVLWHISLERFWWGLWCCFKPHLNKMFAQEVMSLQNGGSPNFGNFETPKLRISDSQLGSLETKWHLGVSLVARHREYYKWKGGGFPQIQAVVSFVILCLPIVCSCTKSAPTIH
jgi:hypothetical protein